MRCNVTKYLWQSIYIAPHILLTLWWTPNLAFCSNKRLLKYAGVLYCSWQSILYIAEWFLCLILAFDVLIFARLLLGLFLFFLASRLSRWVHFRIWFSCWIIQMCIIFMIESETEFADIVNIWQVFGILFVIYSTVTFKVATFTVALNYMLKLLLLTALSSKLNQVAMAIGKCPWLRRPMSWICLLSRQLECR